MRSAACPAMVAGARARGGGAPPPGRGGPGRGGGVPPAGDGLTGAGNGCGGSRSMSTSMPTPPRDLSPGLAAELVMSAVMGPRGYVAHPRLDAPATPGDPGASYDAVAPR